MMVGSTARSHSEIEGLGFDGWERSVSGSLPWIRSGRGAIRARGTLLPHHREALAARDVVTVPSGTFRLLAGWFLTQTGRRRIVRWEITAASTIPWGSSAASETVPVGQRPVPLLLDRGRGFAQSVVSTILAMDIEPTGTPARSPWQSGMAERWIPSCRRELPDIA